MARDAAPGLGRPAAPDRPVLRRLLALPARARPGRRAGRDAFENAREIVDVERGLGLFVEPAVHAWSEAQRWMVDVASWMYVNSHFAITTVTLAFLYLRRNERFYFVRNMFMVAMGIALVGYVAFPTAPPRFMPELGLPRLGRGVHRRRREASNALFNPFAAVPSMHVAFALMLARADGQDRPPALGARAVVRPTRRSSPSSSSRPPTTGGSTRSSARPPRPSRRSPRRRCSPARGRTRGPGSRARLARGLRPLGLPRWPRHRSRRHAARAAASTQSSPASG